MADVQAEWLWLPACPARHSILRGLRTYDSNDFSLFRSLFYCGELARRASTHLPHYFTSTDTEASTFSFVFVFVCVLLLFYGWPHVCFYLHWLLKKVDD